MGKQQQKTPSVYKRNNGANFEPGNKGWKTRGHGMSVCLGGA